MAKRKYAKSRRSKARKFRSKKKYYRKKATKQVIRQASLVPDRTFVKLRFTQLIDLNSITGADTYVFSGNSIYDPDVTGVGNQPMGFDEWARFYNKYRVRGSKIRLMAVATGASHVPTKITIHPQDDSTTGASIDAAPARPYARTKITSGYGGPQVYLSNYMSSKKMFGQSSLGAETSYASLMTGNPNIRWYWLIQSATLDQNFTVTQLYCEVQITYYVEMYDIVDLNLS